MSSNLEHQVINNSKIQDLEIKFLNGNVFNFLSDEENKILKELIFNKDDEIEVIDLKFLLSENFLSNIIPKLTELTDSPDLESKIDNFKSIVVEEIKLKKSYKCEFKILLLAISALQKFLECNWTGPQNDTKPSIDLFTKIFSLTNNDNRSILLLLARDGESIYENTVKPELLLFCDLLLDSLLESNCITAVWWKFRSLMIHQHILLDKSITIYKNLESLSPILLKQRWIQENKSFCVQLHIELSLMNLRYHEVVKAKKFISIAQDKVGLEIELSGAFGKRTLYQQKVIAQLLLRLKRCAFNEDIDVSLTEDELPKDLSIQDDVLLNKVKFVDDSDNFVQELNSMEQIVLMAHCCLMLKCEASDEIRNEKIMAYIDCLLQQKKIWAIHFKSLFIRCRLDKLRSRKVERGMMQLEHLLSILRNEKPDALVRQYLFYSTFFSPFWVIQQELADLLFSLGAVKSALEVYEKLGWWEGIVKCYYVLGRHEEIASLVREKLSVNETPALWCLLGDATNEIDCYKKAWELSNFKSARSQTAIGNYYYKKRDYVNCISYFEQSLELNHLQPNVWFSLGFAATQISNYELAVSAYRHVTSLDSDHFEAWNNLSSAYIKLQQKERAFFTFQEAIKCNYEDWHIWENYLLVCLDVGAFEEAIHACHRILDLKNRFEDVEVLEIIAKAIKEDVMDITKQNASRLKKQALQLFGRVTSIVINNGDIWRCYALLHMSDPTYKTHAESLEVIVIYLQKAVTCTLQKPHALKDIPSCRKVLHTACELANAYEAYTSILEGQIKVQTLTQAKLSLKNILTRIEKQLKNFNVENSSETDDLLASLHASLNSIEMC